jgi:hypothetical protein
VGVVVLGNRTYFPALKVGDQMLRALVRAEAAPIRRLTPAPSLEVARDAVERLLAAWDDDLAAATFSMNVDLDEPLARRRAAFERLRETHGPLHRSDAPSTSDTPLHAEWWLDAAPGRGRVRVEITMDPQAVPKLQYMELTSIPEPGPELRAAAEALVAAANAETTDGPALGDGADRTALERDRVLVTTFFGRATLGPPTAAGPVGALAGATFRVDAEHGALDLAITVDAEGRVLSATWTPRPVRPPISDVR